MKKAFTLSEVLITLVIIGVVAALTIPVLQENYLEQERIAKVKKSYSMLANAMTLVKADGGDMVFEVANDSDENMRNWFEEYLEPHIIKLKVCYNKSGCWNDGNTRNLNGSSVYYNRTGIGVGANIITVVLQDGTFLNIDAYGKASIAKYFGMDIETDNALVVFFDINGAKKPNMMGKDIFVTVFTENGLVPAWSDRLTQEREADCSSKGTGYACINKYLTKF